MGAGSPIAKAAFQADDEKEHHHAKLRDLQRDAGSLSTRRP
jgi:hypothetical protein